MDGWVVSWSGRISPQTPVEWTDRWSVTVLRWFGCFMINENLTVYWLLKLQRAKCWWDLLLLDHRSADIWAVWLWVSTTSSWCLRSLSLNTDKNSPLLFEIVVLEYSHFTVDVLCGCFRTLYCGCFQLFTRTVCRCTILDFLRISTENLFQDVWSDCLSFQSINKNLMIFQLQEVWGY